MYEGLAEVLGVPLPSPDTLHTPGMTFNENTV